MERIKKAVLAYSGGLDTTVIIHWLKAKYKCDVITFTGDVGYGKDLASVKKRAVKAGAKKVYSEDLREEFITEYAFPALQANAVYENKYLLATALSRPLIAKKLVEVAKKEKADAVAHGCTGKGNDQVRFEVTIASLAPELKVLAPVREWELRTRIDEIRYAEKHGLDIPVKKSSPYSIDTNLWGVSIECGVLEDAWKEPPHDAYQVTVAPEKAPDKPTCLEISFESGLPKAINGKTYSPVNLVEKLNATGGKNGIGRVDMVENRLIGIKSREIYESPAAAILHACHRDLESLVLDRETLHFKEMLSQRYGELVYYGLWDSLLKKSLDGFVRATQKNVTGTIKVKLYKGTCTVTGRKSPYSLYSKKLSTYGKEDAFDQKLAKGFIELWSLPFKKRQK